jgi:hypothetical protein
MIFLKLSLGMFFLRLLVDKWQRRIVYAVMVTSTVIGFGYWWYAVFQCGLPNGGEEAFWEKRLAGKCASSKALVDGTGYVHGGVMVITDITLTILPVSMLRRSLMPWREKLVVGGILTLACMQVFPLPLMPVKPANHAPQGLHSLHRPSILGPRHRNRDPRLLE